MQLNLPLLTVCSSRLRQQCRNEMTCKSNRHAGSWLGRSPFLNIDIERMKQVPFGDQPWYPHVLWPLRWTIAHSTWMVPLLNNSLFCKIRNSKKTNRLEVLHLFKCFTHTHTRPATHVDQNNGSETASFQIVRDLISVIAAASRWVLISFLRSL